MIIGACGCPPDLLEGVRVYDASTGDLWRRLPGTKLISALELSPDGSLMAAADWGLGEAAGRRPSISGTSRLASAETMPAPRESN